MIRAEFEMRKQGKSQTQLAQETGINRVSINMVMRGKSHVWPKWKSSIAAALNWPTDRAAELFEEIKEVK